MAIVDSLFVSGEAMGPKHMPHALSLEICGDPHPDFFALDTSGFLLIIHLPKVRSNLYC